MTAFSLYIIGATIEGRPRIGKSYAIDFVRQNLASRHPKMSVYRIRCSLAMPTLLLIRHYLTSVASQRCSEEIELIGLEIRI